ncbi:hypothetical protein CC80DRAFT_526536 [Byssothecium circinans]|uniref:WD40 repeat-like protein n=1 Tax=Byssothecium circinans TaxID=147558 RepID=A0A6A5TSM8_9PLEO|nr:hypothetical protein CC80DRAFT_526536 [Byssothecium circinans]
MENVDVSPQFKSTSLPAPSPTASHIAHLTGARLQVRSLSTFEIVRNVALPSNHDVRNSHIAWSPSSSTQLSPTSRPPHRAFPSRSHRFLVADADTTRVYDLRDDKWNAVISNGSGGMGKNVHIEFGRDDEEVLIWSGFASRAVVWCLRTGRTVEVRDPKFDGKRGRGWGYRACEYGVEGGSSGRRRGDIMATLCRTSGQDVLMLLAPKTYSVLKRVELPTVDAQGLKWSRDGRWIAIWDSAAHGYRLFIYTADGHLYRTITREPSDELNEWGIEGLGIKTVEWIPGNEWLAIGGWDRRVRILSTRTFAPGVYLDHTATISIPSAPIYTEHLDSMGNRSYTLTQQPAMPPKAMLEKNETGLMKQGIGIMGFNKNGTLCATRDDSTPTTVWIWDLMSLKPRMILIQHAPIKSLSWHPTSPSHLLIQTTHDSPTIYIYTAPSQLPPRSTSTSRCSSTTMKHSSAVDSNSTPNSPSILNLLDNVKKPAGSLPVKWTARWLTTPEDKKPVLVFGHQQGYVTVWPEGKDQILRFEDQEGEESDDSLYDILTGRTPVYGDEATVGYQESTGSVGLEDTFGQRSGAELLQRERERGVFDESGLDEMF